jgi:hypothetical protein
MKQKSFMLLIFVVMLIFLLSACGRNNRDPDERDNNEPRYNGTERGGNGETEHETLENGALTLSVLASNLYSRVINETGTIMTQYFAEQDIDFSIELTTFSGREEAEAMRARFRIMLMAGEGYDLFFWDNEMNIRNLAVNGFLADFYPLIDNHPTTNREDFFMNVLEAYEIDGGLYAFPLSFGFEYVGISALLPQSIIEQFTWRDSITVHELLRLNGELNRNYCEEFGYLGFSTSITLGSAYNVTVTRMADFIDYENNVSHLNTEPFVNFLEDLFIVFQGRLARTTTWSAGNLPIGEHKENMARTYMFDSPNTSLLPLTVLFEHIEPFFLNYIPLADDNGRLLMSPSFHGVPTTPGGQGTTWAKVVIPAVGNGQLAWEFVHRLILVMVNQHITNQGQADYLAFGRRSLVTPIARTYFEPHVNRILVNATAGGWFTELLPPFVGVHDGGDRRQANRDAMARLAEFNEMPAAVIQGHNLPDGIILSPLDSFLLGLSTAQATAQEIHNRITLWLIE